MTDWMPVAAVALVLGGVWWHGAQWGEARADARHEDARRAVQADLFREADALSMRAFEMQQQEAALSARAQEAEDAARADPDECRVPDPGSLRRLDRRWHGANGF